MQKANIPLRERQTQARRRHMLDAAEMLIRQGGNVGFSMRTLASVAEVSQATPYNFFGSKEGLLFALLSRSLDSFISEGLVRSSDDPIAHVIDTANNAATILLRDPVFLRPLYQVMLGLTDPVHRVSCEIPASLRSTGNCLRQAKRGNGLRKSICPYLNFMMANLAMVKRVWASKVNLEWMSL